MATNDKEALQEMEERFEDDCDLAEAVAPINDVLSQIVCQLKAAFTRYGDHVGDCHGDPCFCGFDDWYNWCSKSK